MTSESDTIIAFPNIKEIEAEAVLWVMRIDEGDISQDGQEELRIWLGQGEAYREAFTRLSTLWGGLDVLEELNDHAAADDNLQLLKIDATPRWKFAGANLLRRSARLTAIAASLAIVLATGLIYTLIGDQFKPYIGVFETAIGEQRQVSLPDGSSIQINTGSRVEVAFSKDARNIRLVQGEAHFDVAPDKKKPFSVYAGTGVVTAVGTSFTVYLRNKKVDVIVEEGRVALSSHRGNSDFYNLSLIDRENLSPVPLAEITAGQNAVFAEKIESLDLYEPKAVKRKLSWREGRLSFSGETLSEVVSNVSRYTDIIIEIDDEHLRNLPIAGNFNVGEIDAMFEALEIMIGVRIEHVGTKRVRILSSTS